MGFFLSGIIFALNCSCHTMSNLTPNVILFGRDLPNVFDTGTLQNMELKPVHEYMESILEKQRYAYSQVTRRTRSVIRHLKQHMIKTEDHLQQMQEILSSTSDPVFQIQNQIKRFNGNTLVLL